MLPFHLTPVELEIVKQMQSLCKIALVAQAIGVSEETVRTHLMHIRAKSGKHSTWEAVTYCHSELTDEHEEP